MKIFKLVLLLLTLNSCAAVQEITNTTLHRDKYSDMKISEKNTPIANDFSQDKAFELFKKEICEKSSTSECNQRYGQTFFARLVQTYNLVSEDSVITHCSAYPIECKQMTYIESIFIKKFNNEVNEMKKRDYARIEKQDRENFGRALSAYGAAIEASKPVVTNCYSDGFGNTRCASTK